MLKKVNYLNCRVSVAEIIDLRHRILREGLSIESAHFDADNHPQTWHVARYLRAGEVNIGGPLCCASFMFNSFGHQVAWQLRGMAAEIQHKGSGSALLNWAMKEIVEKEYTRLFWCNARLSAVGFYEKMGWQYVSDVFDIPTVGPHHKMKKIFLNT